MNKENEDNYLKSLENRAFQESIFSNLTTANFLEQVNKKKAVASNSATHSSSGSLPISTEESTNQTNKRIEEIEQYVGKDSIKINNNDLSVGTIIKRAAMMKHINYKLLTPSDIALVDCGFNCILDLTHGSLTNQHLLFSKEDWNRIKALFSTSPTNNDLIESRPTLRKIDRIFKNPRDTEECYWKSKNCQRKASKFNEKTGYELISVIIDKMIKHNSIFTLSKPTPSEADVMIKIWADIFEVLFYNTGIYVRWGEKRLATDDNDATIFKLDAKLVLLYDAAEYPVCAVEFASYAGSKKIKTDRSKLLVEAKVICDKVMELNINEENAALLNIVNIQIMGLETNVMSLNLVDNHLYAANSLKSYMLPSTVPELKKHSKTIIGHIFDLKHYTLNTADIIKQTLNDKKKTKKSMKRKIQEDEDQDEASPSLKARAAPTWRHKARRKIE